MEKAEPLPTSDFLFTICLRGEKSPLHWRKKLLTMRGLIFFHHQVTSIASPTRRTDGENDKAKRREQLNWII
jgi:hypothetical protein